MLTIQNKLNDSERLEDAIFDGTRLYYYLNEPLYIKIIEDDNTQTSLNVDINVYDTSDDSFVTTHTSYAVYDLITRNSETYLSIDLMALIRQIHDANVYKYSSLDDFTADNGYTSIVSKYKYDIIFTASDSVTVKLLPIIGGRQFEQIDLYNFYLTEFEYYGLNDISLRVGDFDNSFSDDFGNNAIEKTEYERRWGGVSFPRISLKQSYYTDASPSITILTNDGCPPKGGFLIWKSRFGGWCYFGFDMQTRTNKNAYSGKITQGLYEVNDNKGMYVPVNYTSTSMTYTRTMKAYALTNAELLALSGIAASPAIYYVKEGTKELELMKLTAMSAPYSTDAMGGDFSVTLSNISTSQINTI